MRAYIKNNIKFLIAMIIVITLGIIGITYAIKFGDFNPIGLNVNTSTIRANITYDSTVNEGNITSTGNMLPISDTLVTGVDVTDTRVLKVKFMVTGVSTNPSNTIYDISLRDINMSSALKTEEVKWKLYKNGTEISTGNFSPTFDIMENNRLVLTNTQQDLTTSTDTYVFLMWISESCTDDLTTCTITNSQNKYSGKTFSATIKLEANTKSKKTLTRNSIPSNAASVAITNMFAPNNTVINNNIEYRYDTSNNLMEDVGGNIRYYGASPNNYIYFNCSDYSNQTSDTCETWRIIGVFEGKVKIMRNSTIGSYSWDNKNTSTGAETDYGKNDWTDARLMKLLNPGYESETTGGSLYYNSISGSCYSGKNNATVSCDFTNTGIKNDTTRNLISDTLYYLGGWYTSEIYSDQIYGYERGEEVYSGRPTTWTGKIALPYSSDYGYAADLGSCTVQLGNYNNSTCTSANWMKNIITNNGNNVGWLLTSHLASNNAWGVSSSGGVNYYGTYYAGGAAPVLYLGSELGIGSGTGTNSDPYRLSVS